jgi:hypothetical protein
MTTMTQAGVPESAIILAAKADAIARCRKKHGDAVDAILSQTATLEQALEIAERESVAIHGKDDSRHVKMARALIFFAKKVDVYAKAVDVYVNKSPDIASVVWGSCRVLLQVCHRYKAKSLSIYRPLTRALLT